MNWILLTSAAAVFLVGALLSTLLSITETVVLSLRDYRVRAVLTRRSAGAPIAELWKRGPEKLLPPIIALGSSAHFAVAGAAFILLRESGFLDPLGPRRMLQVAAGTLAGAFFLDFLPKRFALMRQDPAARIAAQTLRALRPLGRIPGAGFLRKTFLFPFAWFSRRFVRRRPVLGDEVGTLLSLAGSQGIITDDEREVMLQILEFSRKTARDCMTPRVEVPAAPDPLDLPEALSLAQTCQERFLPLYREDPDDIVALLDLREVLLRPQTTLAHARVSPRFIPETTEILDFLAERPAHEDAPAVVLDEHGSFEGALSRSRLIEQLLLGPLPGDPANHDIQELVPGKRFLVRGGTRLEALSRHSKGNLEREGIDTVAGLVFTEFGRLPEAGEEVALNGFRFRVQRVTGARIEEVLVERLPKTARRK